VSASVCTSSLVKLCLFIFEGFMVLVGVGFCLAMGFCRFYMGFGKGRNWKGFSIGSTRKAF